MINMTTELQDNAVPGDTLGQPFDEVFDPIETNAPQLRCKHTGAIYPNQFPFTERSDILEPYFPPSAKPPQTAATVAPTTTPEIVPVPIADPVVQSQPTVVVPSEL
jgi:hypothetical protein